MKVIIEKWSGGLGNNLIQLYHAICLAFKLVKAVVQFPEHRFLIGTTLPLKLSAYTPGNVTGVFFQQHQVEFLLKTPLPTSPTKRSIFQNYIRPLLRLQEHTLLTFRYVHHLILPMAPKLDRLDCLVIHIRSGDITNGTDAHPNYVQPPLSFYQRVVLDCALPVLVVTQDNSNPCVQALKTWRPDITVYKNRSLLQDMTTLLRARHLCYGKSWLPITLALCSECVTHVSILDNIYTADFMPDSTGVIVNHYQLTQPYIPVGSWQNSPQQRKIMLDYPLQHVSKIKRV